MVRVQASLVLLVLACLAAGCGAPRAKYYSIGLCGVRDTNDLPLIRAAGFNLVLGNATRGFLDAADAAGLRVIAAPGTVAGPRINRRVLRECVSRLDDHPALWAWLLADEPEMKGVSPDEVRVAHRLVKSAGGRQPTSVILWQGYEALHFGNIADITICDRYPIPWLPLANFGQHLRMVRLALGKIKPLLAVVQAFDWAYYPELRSENPERMRPPSYAEMRCMTYCALAEGVDGLLYYTFDDGPGRWRMAEHLDTWAALLAVAQEVNHRLPLFQAERRWWSKDQKWEDPSRRFNAALESSVSTVFLRVKRGNAYVTTGEYLIAVNNTDQELVYSFALPLAAGPSVPVLEEGRCVVREHRWVTDRFKAYDVHIYGPLRSDRCHRRDVSQRAKAKQGGCPDFQNNQD